MMKKNVRRAKKDEQQHTVDPRLLRMQQALSLGIRTYQDGTSKWCNVDLGVQLQALRSIYDVMDNLPPNISNVPSMKDILKTLEVLLQVKNEQVSQKATEICLKLASACNHKSSSLTSLVAPLARLLSTNTLSASGAVALRIIIDNLNPVQQKNMLADIKDANALDTITRILEEGCVDKEVLASYVELLAVILENFPSQRYAIVGRASIRNALLEYACNSSDDVSAASLRALSSSTICSDVARLVSQEKDLVSSVFKTCLSDSRFASIKTESFHLFICLAKFSAYLSGQENDIDIVVSSCIQILAAQIQWSLEVEQLLMAAAHATCLLLSIPGRHRLRLLSGGIVPAFRALLHETRSGNKKWRLELHGLIYESVGWIACLCNKDEEAFLISRDYKQMIDHLCSTFLSSLLRKGRKYEFVEDVDGVPDAIWYFPQFVSSQETLHICRAVSRLVSSPSEKSSSYSLRALEKHLEPYGESSLASLVDSLHLGYSGGRCRVLPDKAETLVRLYGLSTALHLPGLRQELDYTRILQVLSNLIEQERSPQAQDASAQVLSNLIEQDASAPVRSFRVLKTCCYQGTDDWACPDDLLFAAVSTLGIFLSFQVRESSKDDDNTLNMLRALASDKKYSDGVRWWASFSLSCYGYYGIPNAMDHHLAKLKDDPTIADLRFVFPNGSNLSVHGAILAARCPKLLPEKNDGHSEMRVIRISNRITYRAFKGILEYVYTGSVRLEADQLPEVKALAKRCDLDSLLMFLNKKTPVWGRRIDTGSLEPALDSNIGRQYCDMVLKSSSGGIQVHGAILSVRSDYFQALLRSGMRESFENMVQVPVRIEVISRFVHYMYSDELDVCTWGCAWTYLGEEQQLDLLEQLIDLAGISEQWLLNDLLEECLKAIRKLRPSLAVYPKVMKHAYKKRQWDVVGEAAECMARDYPKLRDMGALDCLDDELADMVRASYVKLSLERH